MTEQVDHIASIYNKERLSKIVFIEENIRHCGLPHNFPKLRGSSANKIFNRINGDCQEKREWLLFRDNHFYCTYCLCFSANRNARLVKGAEYKAGCRITQIVNLHENERHHLSAEKMFQSAHSSNDKKPAPTGDAGTSSNGGMQADEKRSVLSTIVKIIIFIATHGLAFRSHASYNINQFDADSTNNFFRSDANEGNFIGLVRLLAGENAELKRHIEICQERSKNGIRNQPTFLTPRFIQNVLAAIKRCFVRSIVNEITRNGGKFSILMDGTQDLSFKEQVSFVVRYFTDSVIERTIAFCHVKTMTGVALYHSLCTVLRDIGLATSQIIGCSFDGALNMRSDINGVNGLIQQENPFCIYVWCLSHRFNLVVKAAISCVPEIGGVLEIAERSAKLFRGSYLRMNVWIDVVKSVPNYNSLSKLKLIGKTRWSSNQDAIASIIGSEVSLFVLIKALVVTCSQSNLKVEYIQSANSNLNDWLCYENVVRAFVLHKIFALTAPTTKFLQTSGLNIMEGIQCIQLCHQRLERAKHDLRNYIAEADDLIRKTNNLINDDEQIKELNCNCSIRRSIYIDQQQLILHIETEFQKFIDKLHLEMYERILNVTESSENGAIYHEMQFLDPEYTQNYIKNGLNSISLKKLCEINNVDEQTVILELKRLTYNFLQYKNRPRCVSVLDNNEREDLDSNDEEMVELIVIIEDDDDLIETNADVEHMSVHRLEDKRHFILEVLEYINAIEIRKTKFENIYKLYKFVAIMPTTQVKCERDFSKLKLIKTRLRMNMNAEMLEQLILIAVESDMFNTLSLDDITDEIIKNSGTISKYIYS